MPDYGTGQKAKEIILSGGDLEYRAYVTGDLTGGGSWTSIGFTAKDAGGMLTDKQPTFKDVKVTGQDDPVKRKAIDREINFKTTILQSTLANIAIATGGVAADVVAGVFKGGKSVDAVDLQFRYTVQNEDDSAKDQRLYLPRANVVDSTEIPWGDEKESAIVLTLKAEAVVDSVLYGGASLVGYRYVITEGSY